MKVNWVKYKDGGGPSYKGEMQYNPAKPWGVWSQIMGVVARCEGCHDTVVMYDGTAVTWGHQQWTFTSGRLQKLLESFKSIPSYDVEREGEGSWTLFDDVCCTNIDVQTFESFGFRIEGGKFVEITGAAQDVILDPSYPMQKNRIVDICMGRVRYSDFPNQKNHAMKLAEVFAKMGAQLGVAEAQITFAKAELQRALKFTRKPLGAIETIDNLLAGTWETPAPALFFNLWQNNPGAAYKLFLKAKSSGAQGQAFFDKAWQLANRSTFGNWGWKEGNKSPRVTRIKSAIKEFYGIDLPFFK